MVRTSLMCMVAAISCVLVAAPAAAERPVKSGALDVCQIDGGEVEVIDGIEACCADSTTEFDDGHIDFGTEYCVACIEGTDDCTLYEQTRRMPSMQQVKKSLSLKTKKATITGN